MSIFETLKICIGMYNTKYKLLREWAYAGYLYNCILALAGNAICPEGEFTAGAVVAIVLLMVSYFTRRKVYVS